MNKIFIAILGIGLLSGCKMKEFSSTPFYEGNTVKYTGAVEDRVNLWPVAYWREPVGSVAWPLLSFGNDHFALRPLYSQYKKSGKGEYDEYNVLWPIAQFDTDDKDYRIFPFFWGSNYSKDPYFCLFPAVWYNDEFAGVLPFFWRTDKYASGFCVFPLFWTQFHRNVYRDDSFWHTLFPLYYYQNSKEKESSKFWAFCGLAGYNCLNEEFIDHRFWPFYHWERGDFYSIPYARYQRGSTIKNRILLGLAGNDSNTNGEYVASWVFPLYYHNKENQEFLTPLYGSLNGGIGQTNRYFACGLVGTYSGKIEGGWVFPVFNYKKDKSFKSPLYSWDGGGTNQTNSYYALSIAGKRSGGQTGWWLFPFYNKKKDPAYDKEYAYLNMDKLPEEIQIWDAVRTNRTWNAKKKCYEIKSIEPIKEGTHFYSYNTADLCLVFDNDRNVRGWAHYEIGDEYTIKYNHNQGNRLAYRYESDREVTFDVNTRKKTSDIEEGESSLFFFLYNASYEIDRMTNKSYASRKVLLKLWDWEEKNGDVSLDVFPGFTYDSKTNGYTKTSFLWRFFRYERDPKEGTSVDILFIPIWR